MSKTSGVTPAIVISGALGFDPALKAYLVSMSLMVSGVATFIQVRKVGPIGSGLLSIQGTSFTFLSLIITIGFSVKGAGGTQEQMMAAIVGTTFSQNNGVIQMTGVASRYVGYFIAGLLFLFGLFPIVGGVFSIIPASVIGGAMIVMAGTIAASGIRIISTATINRRGILIIAISLGLGMGVVLVPAILNHFAPFWKAMFASPITTGGLTAILLNIVLPRELKKQKVSTNPVKDVMGQQEG